MFKGKNIVKMRNVLAVSALAFIAMPALTSAEEIGGSEASASVAGSALTENVTLKSNVTLTGQGFDVAGKVSADADAAEIKAITIDLGGYKLTTGAFAAFSTTKEAVVTIKNGTLVCEDATCVSAANLILDNVKIEGTGTGAVIATKTATITNSNLKAVTFTDAKATVNGGAIGTPTATKDELKISGRVEGPKEALTYAQAGATIVLNSDLAPADDTTPAARITIPENVTLELAANKTVKFEAQMSPEDAARVKVSIPDYELKLVKDSVGTYKLQAILADFTEFDKVWKEFQKWDDDAKKVADAKDKYTKVLYNEIITAAGKISATATRPNYVKSTQSYVDNITKNLKAIMSGSAVDPSIPTDPVDPDKKPTDPVTPENPDGNKGDSKPDQSGDDKKTGDNIMGYVSLALTSLGGLAVAVKKYLFR